MLGKLLPVTLAAFLIFSGMRAGRSSSANLQSQQPLEVFITELLQWKNGCLQVSIDRVNRSSSPIFLPESGLYISASATTAVPPSGHNSEISWFPVYGASDLLDLSATRLAPGETKHIDTCVGPTFFVTNLKEETRREVQVRGQLRIDSSYFLSEQDWLTNKSQREEMLRTTSDKWPKPLQPEVVTVIMSIPCHDSPCKASCDGPPIVFDGEVMIVPDVGSFKRERNKRGRAINEELAKRFSPCPAP